MNTIKQRVLELFAASALLLTAINMNLTCRLYVHQPEMPKGAEKLRKYN